jgi:hypothetical protein
MRTRLRRAGSALLLAVAGLLACPSGSAEAHPFLVGRWVAPVPPGGLMVYEFGPGEYRGNWLWRGPFNFSVGGCLIASGIYELQMITGTDGTLKLMDTYIVSGGVGTVNFTSREMIYKTVIFRP